MYICKNQHIIVSKVDKESNIEITKNCRKLFKKIYSYWSDRKKKVTSPLISCIIFVKIEEIKLNEIYKIQGITGVLKYLKKPAKIKEFEIENLKILLNDAENISTVENVSFEKGDTVRVIKGPFLGLIAQCFEIKGKHRIIVNITSTNNVFEVNVPMSFVEKYKAI